MFVNDASEPRIFFTIASVYCISEEEESPPLEKEEKSDPQSDGMKKAEWRQDGCDAEREETSDVRAILYAGLLHRSRKIEPKSKVTLLVHGGLSETNALFYLI